MGGERKAEDKGEKQGETIQTESAGHDESILLGLKSERTREGVSSPGEVYFCSYKNAVQ
jgi:hypothetical protein